MQSKSLCNILSDEKMGLSLMNMFGLSSSICMAHIACYSKFFFLHYLQVLCQYRLGTDWSVLRFSRYSHCMDPTKNIVPPLMWVTWYHASHCTEPLTGNGRLCRLNYSGFQQICHNIYIYIYIYMVTRRNMLSASNVAKKVEHNHTFKLYRKFLWILKYVIMTAVQNF
jgi:hypothetical protein